MLKLQNVDGDTLVSLRKEGETALVPLFHMTTVFLWRKNLKNCIYVDFLFQIHRGISKNFIQRYYAQEGETFVQLEQEASLKKERLCTWPSCSVLLCRESIDVPRLFAPALRSPAAYFYNNLIDGPLTSSLGLTELSRFVTTASSSCYRTSKTP